jgi:hypothetical protein
MMHSPSPAFRQPAIPAVGFLHGVLTRRNVPDVVHAECGAVSASFIDARDPYIAYVGANDRQRARLPRWLDYAAAAFIVTAVAFAPALTWLLAR